MADLMTFPDTWEEFEQDYGFTDVEQVYTNGSRLIQSFRVKQWLDHISDETKAETDTISRQALMKEFSDFVRASNSSDFAQTPTWNDAVSLVGSMPSAQPEPIRINLNESIKVKLTDWGKDIYYHQYDRINQIAGRKICKPKFPKEDENGYTEFQLWCFIELYGEYMGMTLPNVIEPLEIVYGR